MSYFIYSNQHKTMTPLHYLILLSPCSVIFQGTSNSDKPEKPSDPYPVSSKPLHLSICHDVTWIEIEDWILEYLTIFSSTQEVYCLIHTPLLEISFAIAASISFSLNVWPLDNPGSSYFYIWEELYLVTNYYVHPAEQKLHSGLARCKDKWSNCSRWKEKCAKDGYTDYWCQATCSTCRRLRE